MNCESKTPRFADVKAILDALVAGHDPADLKQVHHSEEFGWETAEQLASVVVRPVGKLGLSFRLIAPDLVAAKRGADTNLVKALRDPTGVEFNGQMPRNTPPGRLAKPEEIELIVTWINAGMPA